MARYLGAKCRLCRREGSKLFLKGERCYSPQCPLEKKGPVPPGQHGAKRQRRLSNYGQQLREKQKVKRLYGVLERQFKKYFRQAFKSKGETGKVLLEILESRLDNIVYRLGLSPSRSVARQLVSHGHVLVDNQKVNVPSFLVKPGQTVSLDSRGLKVPSVKAVLADKTQKVPAWLQRQAAIGKIKRLPERKEMPSEIDENLIVEFYSR